MRQSNINVLHVTGRVPAGGVLSFLSNLTSFSRKENFSFRFVFSASSNISSFKKNFPGYDYFILPDLSLRNSIRYIRHLNEFYKNNKGAIDVVHIHSPNVAFPHLFFAKKYGIPLRILHGHSTRHSDKLLKSLRNYCLTRFNMMYANGRVACGIQAGKFLFGNRCFSIIKNGVDAGKFSYNPNIRERVRRDLQIDNARVYGHVGAYVPVKNHDFLLSVFKEITLIEPCAVLMLLGDGPLRPIIKDRIKTLKLEKKVLMIGHTPAVASYMQAIDQFLLPSLFEGFPYSLVEAQASGLYSIVSDRVDKDAILTDLVLPLSLERSAKEWARAAVEWGRGSHHRQEYADQIRRRGYDHLESVAALEDFYMSQLACIRQQ